MDASETCRECKFVDAGFDGVPDSACPTKSSRRDFWNGSRNATSVEGVTTDNGLSEIYSMKGRCAAERVGASGLSAGNVQF